MKKTHLTSWLAAATLTSQCNVAAYAQFAGSYSPGTWSTTNSNSNGTVNSSGAPNSISITGPNNNSRTSGYIQFTNTARQKGIYKFNWSYTTTDGARYDYPQFVLNGTRSTFRQYSTIGADNQTGAQAYTLSKGDQFGFAVYSVDNIYGAATVTISGFLYPLLYTSSAQPYANIQSVSIDALKNQRELVLARAGDCNQNGWVIYDSEKVKGKSKPKKHQSLCVFGEGGYAQGDINGSTSIGGYSTSNATTAYGI